jgi:hypothetical protein
MSRLDRFSKFSSGMRTGLEPRERMLRHSIYFEWPYRWLPEERGDVSVIHELLKDEIEDHRYHHILSFGPDITKEPTASHNGSGYFPVEGQIKGVKGPVFPFWVLYLSIILIAFGVALLWISWYGLVPIAVALVLLPLADAVVQQQQSLLVLHYKGGIEQTVDREPVYAKPYRPVKAQSKEVLHSRVELKILISLDAKSRMMKEVINQDFASVLKRIDYILKSKSIPVGSKNYQLPVKFFPLLVSRRASDFEYRFPIRERGPEELKREEEHAPAEEPVEEEEPEEEADVADEDLTEDNFFDEDEPSEDEEPEEEGEEEGEEEEPPTKGKKE